MEKERFTIEKVPMKEEWLCTDNENGIECYFEQGKFEEKKVVVKYMPDPSDILEMNKDVENLDVDMLNWLRKYHLDKIS